MDYFFSRSGPTTSQRSKSFGSSPFLIIEKLRSTTLVFRSNGATIMFSPNELKTTQSGDEAGTRNSCFHMAKNRPALFDATSETQVQSATVTSRGPSELLIKRPTTVSALADSRPSN